MKSKSGFTIVEVVVVVVVLGILAAIVTVSLVRLQTEQRDARRATTAALIIEAVEKYYDKNGEYPYANELNPTGNKVQMPNYDTVTALLPSLTTDVLNTEGYRFIPHGCLPPNPSCGITQAELDAIDVAFTYYSARAGDSGGYFALTKWGCRIDIASEQNPAAFLAWKEEAKNKWNFMKTKRGGITIANHNTGPTPPTECKFSNAP